ALARDVSRTEGFLYDYQNSVREILAVAPAAKSESPAGEVAAGEVATKPGPPKPPVNPDDPGPGGAQPEEQSKTPEDPGVAASTSVGQELLSVAEFRYVR